MFLAHPSSKDPLLVQSMSQVGQERGKMLRTRKVYWTTQDGAKMYMIKKMLKFILKAKT